MCTHSYLQASGQNSDIAFRLRDLDCLKQNINYKWHNRISPVLQKLYWLPVRRRVELKLACLVHQSLAGQTQSHLASDIQLTADTSHPQLRSASESICVVPRTHNSFHNKSFSAAGPWVWTGTTDISSMHWRDICLSLQCMLENSVLSLKKHIFSNSATILHDRRPNH